MQANVVAGIDLGGTKILTAVADRQGRVLAEVRLATEAAKGTRVILQNVRRSVEQAMSKAELAGLPGAIGIGVPGAVQAGLVHLAPNLGWQDYHLTEDLGQLFGCPIAVANDANLAALGEYCFGAGQGSDNMVYITVSTGVGGGIIYQGEIMAGVSGTAGEIGHITIDPQGPRCNCGGKGCLEAIASGTAIARQARELAAQGRGQGILSHVDADGVITATAVGRAAAAADPEAREILHRAAGALGIGLAAVANILNPSLIVIGGGVMAMREIIWPVMEAEFNARTHRGARRAVTLVNAALGGRAGVLGALALALKEVGGVTGTTHPPV
ncbi:Glucokinase [Desulfotomaculum nigrificans CO-1-SRB]|uniref:Glucokinase n=1 Tax=Desulfotomaculum nigrificans (strain DSM 14880 / VKM B-2319 / CO-1-SRB) TaxID=868595 RepID=F6B4X5_DESCC|nr:ROK family protein [Desulfotomaculum nigrificans]AEF95347.1 Glucokinase [Desulfotomaculum nigrificans CO-1-SRB]